AAAENSLERVSPEQRALSRPRAGVVVDQPSAGEQGIRQLDLRLRQPTPHRADWSPKNCRYFVVRIVATEVPQDSRDAERLRKPLEGFPDPIPQLELLDAVLRAWRLVERVGQRRRQNFPPPSPSVLEARSAQHGLE